MRRGIQGFPYKLMIFILGDVTIKLIENVCDFITF